MNIAVLGGGLAGLCSAWNLTKDGHRIILFEKEQTCGGQSLTFERGGYRYDLGPHNIHTRRPSIINFLKSILKDEIVEHDLRPQVFFRNQRIDYPLLGTQVLRSLPIQTTVACGLSFLLSRIRLFLTSTEDPVRSYESWVVKRFGRRFYNIFFLPYTKKTWGIDPKELSDIVAIKRIPLRNLPELINSVLFKKEAFHPENVRLIRNYYPKRGIGEISDFFQKGILDMGGTIRTGCRVERIILDGSSVTQIHYLDNGVPKNLDFRIQGGSHQWTVFSTIPINELALKFEGRIPESLKDDARKLDFTSEIFLYLNINREDAFGTPLFYFSEAAFPFNRIYDIGLFSRQMVPPGKTALCLELTCSRGDQLWTMSVDDIFHVCLEALQKHALLRREWVEDYHLRKIEHAYPRFRIGYNRILRSLFDFINDIENLVSFGRQGLFSYANVDDVMWMAFEVTKNLAYKERLKLQMEEILPDYIDF